MYSVSRVSLSSSIARGQKRNLFTLQQFLTRNFSKSSTGVESDVAKRDTHSGSSTKGMDAFFADLGGSRRRSKRRQKRHDDTPKGSRHARLALQEEAADQNETKHVNMSNFFNEVNEMMKQNSTKATKDIGSVSEPQYAKIAGASEKELSGTKISILDLLPKQKSRSEEAFDEDAYCQYLELLEYITAQERFTKGRSLTEEESQSVIDWLKAEEPVVKVGLPSLARLMDGALETENPDRTQEDVLSEEVSNQKAKFIESQGWSKTQYDIAVGALAQIGNLSAKNAVGSPVEIAWHKAKEAGCISDKKMIETYLYVSSTFCLRALPPATSKGGSVLDFLGAGQAAVEEKEASPQVIAEDESTDPDIDTAAEVALIQDTLFDASEHSISLRVRVLVERGKALEAEHLLDTNPVDDLRLRTYDPIFQYYQDREDVASALRLYKKMKEIDTVYLRPETYIQLIALTAENGFFKTDCNDIEGAIELGYSAAHGPKLFDDLVAELSHEFAEISSASARRLYNALKKGFKEENLVEMHLLQSFEVCNDRAEPRSIVASRVTVDKMSGVCPRTGVQLRLINLDTEQKEQLKRGLLHLSSVAYEERIGKKEIAAEEGLLSFEKWLQNREGKPFTAVIDGPNIAYYFQNFDEGTFNFHQIQFVIDALENMGENVLLILPRKYTQKSFMLTKASGKSRQYVSKKEREILDNLISAGKIYVVPPSLLDDFYWMWASQGDKWTADEEYIPPNNPEGRWPGTRPMLISNDKMRDHKLSLLEPRLFRRWYSNFIVNFTFSAFVRDQSVDNDIGFSTADFYSREIQANRSDDSQNTVWHFPVSDWDENESFCVRLPAK